MIEVTAEQPCGVAADQAFPVVQRGLERALQTYAVPHIEETTMRWSGSPDAVTKYGAVVTVRSGTVRVKLQADVGTWKRHVVQNGVIATGVVALGIALVVTPRYLDWAHRPEAPWVLGGVVLLVGVPTVIRGIRGARTSGRHYVQGRRKFLQDKLDEVMKYVERNL